MSQLNARLEGLAQQLNSVLTKQASTSATPLIYAAVGELVMFGCKVTQSDSPTTLEIALEGQAVGDDDRWNPDASVSPAREFEYPNMASLKAGAFVSGDMLAMVETAPGVGLARYDIAFVYVGPAGAGFAVATGTPGAGVKTAYDADGLDETAYDPLTDAVIPLGALPVARIYVEGALGGIANAHIADIRSFTGKLQAAGVEALSSVVDTKVSIASIVNNLTSTSTNTPLSAAMGKSLKDQLDAAVIGGGGGGSSTLAGLTDVTLASLATGDLLRYNSVTGDFENKTVAAAGLETPAGAQSKVDTLSGTVSTALAAKAPLASPTFTGTVSGVTKTHVGLGNVDNTTDAGKPVSTATQTALDLKLNNSSVINTLVSTSTTAPLSAAMGKSLKDQLDAAILGGGGGSTTIAGLTDVNFGTLVDNNLLAYSFATSKWVNLSFATLGLATASDLTAKANLASPTFTGTVSGITKTMVGLGSVDNTADTAKPVSTAQQTALNLKANIASPTFTGTVSGVTAAMVGLGSVNNTADSAKPVSTAQQAALDLKAPIANPTFTGSVNGITKAMVGLANTENTSDLAKPISTATQTALDLKAPLASPTFTGTVAGVTKTHVGLSNVDNTADSAKPVSTAQQTALNLKANLASPTFTGTVAGVTKTHVGLANVDNTADSAKPVSTAQQTALNLKANLASPTFTGTVSGVTKTMVGLGSVDNTADSAKPVSTAQQTALDLKANLSAPTFSGTVTATSFAGDGSALTGLPGSTVGASYVKHQYTATAAQTTFSATYGVGYCDVWVNGVKLMLADYTATTGTSVVLASAAALDDQVEIVGWGVTPFSVLSDVDLTTPALNDFMVYEAGVIVNKSAATLGLTGGTVIDEINDVPGLTAALAAKAPLASPTFTGTVSGVTKAHVGLGSVDNTADTAKPVSTAQQTALDLKANLASPTFTGTVSGITKAMVSLGSVDNTADTAKPVSTAQQTALDLKINSSAALIAWNGKTAPAGTVVGTSDVQTLTNKVIGGRCSEALYTITGTTPVISVDNGPLQKWVLTGNSTPTFDILNGESVTLGIDDGTAYTLTLTGVTWKTDTGTAPVLNTSGVTFIRLYKFDSVLYGARIGDA